MSHRCNACVSGAIGHKIGAGLSTSCCIDPASISEAARVGSSPSTGSLWETSLSTQVRGGSYAFRVRNVFAAAL